MGNNKGVGKNGNLVPFSERSKNEARESGRAGGVASGEARRRRKEIREFLRDFLVSPASPALAEKMKKYGVQASDRTNLGGLFLSVFLNAMSGDVAAARQVVEWAGLEPMQAAREEAERLRIAQTVAQTGRGSAGDDSDDEETNDVVIYRVEDAEKLFSEASETGDVDQARKVLRMAGLREDGTEAG